MSVRIGAVLALPVCAFLLHWWKKVNVTRHWILGPPVERNRDRSCGFGSETCSGHSDQAVMLSQGSVIVVDDFLNASEYEVLSTARADQAAFRISREPKTTYPFGNAAWKGRSSMPLALEEAMENILRRIDGYVARQIRATSMHTTGPWAYTGRHYIDLWDLRHYVAGKRRDVHLDTGSFARCLCAMLYLGGDKGAETGEGGNFRTHKCRSGECNNFVGWQHFGNTTPLPRHLIHENNLDLLAEVPYKPGRIVFFLAETLHDVTEVTQGHQDAMLIWWACTPSLLTGAVSNGHVQVVESLITMRAHVDEMKPNGDRPVHRAALAGHTAVLRLLAKQRADLFAVSSGKSQALHFAAAGGHIEALRMLADRGANTSVATDKGLQPMHNAALSGHVVVVKYLSDARASVNAAVDDGARPLHLAAVRGHGKVSELLLGLGADVSAKDDRGSNPMHHAVQSGHSDAVNVLVAFRASISAVDGKLVQPLHIAAQQGYAAIVNALIANGANISAVENLTGAQPIHLAADQGHVAVVELLSQQRANITACDRQGTQPLHLAMQSGHHVLINLLVARSALADVEKRT